LSTGFTLWARHEKVNRGWLPLITGLDEKAGLDELVTRQDRVRRLGVPCKFRLLAAGRHPDER
jgi:hypothetical protein